MKEYIMLYNYDLDDYGTKVIDALLSMFPEAKIENYTVCNPFGEEPMIDHEGVSTWIPEEQYIAAWMFVNTLKTDEIENEYLEDFLINETIQDAYDYLHRQLQYPELYVRYY